MEKRVVITGLGVVSPIGTGVTEFWKAAVAGTSGISAAPQAFVDVNQTEWQRVLDVDLTGVFLCMQAELRQLLRQGDGGAIVNVSSGAGLVPAPGQPHYTAAKHAVLGLTKQAAQEYARNGIRVNAVAPGWVFTDMTRRVFEGPEGPGAIAKIPLGRPARPEEIAGPVAFLASDLASYMYGEVLAVNGGAVMAD